MANGASRFGIGRFGTFINQPNEHLRRSQRVLNRRQTPGMKVAQAMDKFSLGWFWSPAVLNSFKKRQNWYPGSCSLRTWIWAGEGSKSRTAKTARRVLRQSPQ
jgi:hypothetical protein